jgi:hypothetical protein
MSAVGAPPHNGCPSNTVTGHARHATAVTHGPTSHREAKQIPSRRREEPDQATTSARIGRVAERRLKEQRGA